MDCIFYKVIKNFIDPKFEFFKFKNGLNKGDIIFISNHGTKNIGDIIIFEAGTQHPLIHRLIVDDPKGTKGDHNAGQLSIEKNIEEEKIIGKSVAKIPLLGWLKLIFFEPLRPESQRGFCS